MKLYVNNHCISRATTVTGEYGTLVVQADGKYEYTPNTGFENLGKVDVFDYKIVGPIGDEGSSQLTVTIDNTIPTMTTSGTVIPLI